MYCPKCGTQNDDGVQFCSNCGENLSQYKAGSPVQDDRGGYPVQEAGVGALGILFFCIPLAGAVMYFVWKDEKPKKAKQACTLAIWGVAVGIIIQVLSVLLQDL